MPSFQLFDDFARRVEEEMSPAAQKGCDTPRHKLCRDCGHECELGAPECPICGSEFPKAPERLKPCGDCGALNSIAANACHACGASFAQGFTLTLNEALRTGAIVRGMDIEEQEVQDAEEIAPIVRGRILRSGDQRLIKIVQTLPDESWVRLRAILDGQT
jgi:hypothetical protein